MQPDFPFSEPFDQYGIMGLKCRQNGVGKLLFELIECLTGPPEFSGRAVDKIFDDQHFSDLVDDARNNLKWEKPP